MSDEYIDHWLRRAKTPETRERIRRWSRTEDLATLLLMIGLLAFVAMIPVSIGFAIWFHYAEIERFDVYIWGWGSTIALIFAAGILDWYAGERRAEAQFADGQTSVGRIVEVICHPRSGSDDEPAYDVVVSAELPGEVHLRRSLSWGDGDSSGPDQSWIGRPVRFRHNTLDPDDTHDVQFDGFPSLDA